MSAQEGYRLWAPTYDDDPNPLLALEERAVEPLLPATRDKDVFDLGCGTGRWLRKFLGRGARSVLGVDFTLPMLDQAARDSRLKHRLVLGDCLSLPFGSATADMVMCSFTLGHISALDALASEITRVSRPRAEIFLSDLHPESEVAGWRCAFSHQGRSIEIGGHRHTKMQVEGAFQGFALRRSLDLFVGEPERHLFVRGGKGSAFGAARAVPAVAVYHFSLA